MPSSQIGNPTEDTLLPATAAELHKLQIKLREAMVDGGFNVAPGNPGSNPEESTRKDDHPLHNDLTRAAIPHPPVAATASIRGK